MFARSPNPLPTVQVTWPESPDHHDCHIGGRADSPCLLDRIDDNGHNVKGTLSMKGLFNLTIWLVGSDGRNLTLVTKQGNSSRECVQAPAERCGQGDIFYDQAICHDEEKDKWHRCSSAKPAEFSEDLSFSIVIDDGDGGDMSLVIDPPISLPANSEEHTPIVPTSASASPSSTGLSSSPGTPGDNQTSTSATSSNSQTYYNTLSSAAPQNPAIPSPATGEAGPAPTSIPLGTKHHSGNGHSKARTVAPAVVVPIAVLLTVAIAFYLWRRRRRLARVAPSARFKGESPEMKPWLPLDAQRSISRQD